MEKQQFKKKSIANTSFAIFTCLCLLITSFFNIKPIKAAQGYDNFSATLTFKLEDPENLIEVIANAVGRNKRERNGYEKNLNSIVRNGLEFNQHNDIFQEEIAAKKFLEYGVRIFIGADLDVINQPETYGATSTEHFDFLKGLRTDHSTNTISVLNNIRANIKTRLEGVKDKIIEALKNSNTKVFNNTNLNKLILHDKGKDYKELKQEKAASSPTNKRIRLVLDKPLEFVKDASNSKHKNNIDFNLEFTEDLLTAKGIPLTLTTHPDQAGKFDDSNFDFAAFVAFATLFQDDLYNDQASGSDSTINAGMVLPISITEVKIPVSVEYISSDPNIVIPEELNEKLPLIADQSVNQTVNGAKEGEKITTKNGEENFSETVTLNDGSEWKFKGYLKDNDKNNLTDTNIDKEHSITTIYNDNNDEKLNKLIGVWELLTPPTPSVPSTVDVTVEKIWSKGPSTHPSITLNLLQDGKPYMKEGAKVSATLENGKTTHTWNDLPKSNDDGTDFNYTVREEAVENYSAEYQDSSEEINGKKTFKTVITNTYTSPNIEISLTKNWVNGPSEKPTAVFVLYKNGVTSNDHTAVLEKGASTHTFTVPKTDEDGNLIDYSIREVAIRAEGELANSYRSTVQGDSTNGYTITNTYVSPKVNITVSKQWENGDNVRPLSVSVQLKRNGANYKDPVTLNAENNWQHTWNEDKYDNTATIYNYEIEEINIENGFSSRISKEDYNYTITNSYVPSKKDLVIKKEWINGSNLIPNDIKVVILRDNEEFKEITLTKKNNWTETVNVDETDLQGNVYNYSLKEIKVNNFNLKETKIKDNNYTLVNEYVVPTKDITVNKVWVNGPINKPSIEISLLRDGEEVTKVTLNNGEESYTFKSLPTTDNNGNEYEYSVVENRIIGDEELVNSYQSEVNNFTITNTYTSPMIEIKAEKIWVDGPSDKPDISLKLLRNGEDFENNVVVLKNGAREAKWSVPKTDLNGTPYEYTLDEVATPVNYEKKVEGMTVTNTYIIPKMSLTISKKWLGGELLRPESIFVQLKKDNVNYLEPIELNNNNNWTYNFNDLDKTDINGKELVYSIEEVNVDKHFNVNISKEDNGFVITNSFNSPSIKLNIKKEWLGGENERPESIRVQLIKNGNNEGEPIVLSKANNWTQELTVAKYDDSGKAYEYNFIELDELENFNSNLRSDGNDYIITNIHKTSKTGSITIKYISEDGKVLVEDNKTYAIKEVGSDYTSSVKEIPGYVFVKISDGSLSPNGKIKEGHGEVIYVYKKLSFTPSPNKGSVIVKYVDEDGNLIPGSKIEILAENVEVNTAYNSEKKEFNGYTYIGLAKDSIAPSGTVKEGVHTIIYTYKKKVTLIPPSKKQKYLPNTGSDNKLVGIALVSIISAFVLSKKRNKEVNGK